VVGVVADSTAAFAALDRPAPLAPVVAEEGAGPDEILSAPDRFARCEEAPELHEAQAKNVAGAHFALAHFALARFVLVRFVLVRFVLAHFALARESGRCVAQALRCDAAMDHSSAATAARNDATASRDL